VNISLSLDGLKNTHDQIRGVSGAFRKAIETAKVLQSLQNEYNNLSLRVNSVVTDRNYESIFQLVEEIPSLLPHVNVPALTLMRGCPYEKDLYLPDMDNLKLLHKHKISKSPGKQTFLWRIADWANFNLSIETLRSGTQVIPCEAGRILGVIDANGDVRHCEMLPPFGNITERSFKAVWESNEAREERKKIVNQECHCTHECNLYPSLLAHPALGAYVLMRAVFGDFRRER
jgi:MoaA/NifB/PqqE/SkfB family radical SAM enzyme